MSENSWDRLQRTGLQGGAVLDLLNLCMTRDPKDLDDNEAAASRILKTFGTRGLKDLSRADIMDACGLEPWEADRMMAGFWLGMKSAQAADGGGAPISKDREAYEALKDLELERQEHFVALFLDAKGKIISRRTIHIGTLTMSVVGPREVFREAVRANAASVIVAHNHPSGDPSPSPEDLAITKSLLSLGKALDIPVLDHIIIGRGRDYGSAYISLQKEGHI